MEQNEVSGKTLRSLLEHFQPSVVDMNGKQPIPTSMSEGALPAFLYRLGNAASISSSSSSPSMVVKSNAFALEDSTIRRTRTVIPYSVKCQITKLAEENPRITQGEIAQIFGIDRTTVSKILKRRREFSEDPIHSSDMPTNSKLRRFSSELLNHEKHEEEVYIWYKKLNLKNVVVTHSMIMEAAKTLAGTYGMSKTDFNKQWLISFLEKYNITNDVRTDPLTEGK